jgi:alkanesulfonate monooxygenase
MPIRVIGMIGVAPPKGPSPGATVHVIRGGLSPDYLASFARAHEQSGFDLVLVGYTASSAEGFLVTQYAADRTERLGYLIAHRPGFVAPTLAARKIATADHLTGGRIAIHIISGVSDAEQESEGDFAAKPERYRRAAEYLGLLRRLWDRGCAVRSRRRVLPHASRLDRRAAAAAALSAAVLRRLLGRGT